MRFICSNPHCVYAWHPFPECPNQPLDRAALSATADRFRRLEQDGVLKLVRQPPRYRYWLWALVGLAVFVALVILI
ncbi:hypothetical protein IU510_29580 [Nocardia cyriacigeorgica]|uniref:hypothetical protein n=1 Tax=Nocardia cyriacigeorgica TaxID=135487 RepID=UPI0018951BB1|nr:hypothetical protein [Nocardia cyriacigeorgica]MBF6102171.1 hypothetical protein [Nocardia cyriacigeorgica]MBF6347335.1 hypothetical protein [Nocardia cyriacigeorgica]